MPDLYRSIPVVELLPDVGQVRKTFRQEEIRRIADSLKSRGQLQPLRVRWDDERQRYLILTGESRYRAAQVAGLEALDCLVVEGQADEADVLADRIVENSCRSNLEPLEFANAIHKYRLLKSLSASDLAAELGLSNATITRAESLLSLPEKIQAVVGKEKGLCESSAYTISRLETPEEQFAMAEKAITGGWSRAVLEEEVQAALPPKKPKNAGSKLALKLAGGIAVNFAAEKPLKWPDVLTVLERMLAEAKRLADGGKPLGDWSKALKSS